ncbi:MAG: exopolysaccharide biosynthesis polyprenyl glycosylphosphotransferase [Saprospiraceae bacterium]|nr:exopolysaccharide biosynthesis polyprenyl glycosylphosphotransferase [Saprospiraceae bacterium]MBP8943874.1 exopolysaccharide biosynthesis polyprenyl glycosylphosphotransferase [Saprospiraceae bacterium]
MNVKLRDSICYILINGLAFCLTGWLLSFFDSGIAFSTIGIGLILLFITGIIDTYMIEGALDIYRFSRMSIIKNWFFRSFIIWGFVILFSQKPALGIDHQIATWMVLFLVPAFFKLVLLTWSSRRLRRLMVSYRTLLVGSGEKAQAVFKELHSKTPSLGQYFVGSAGKGLVTGLPLLGPADQVEKIIGDLDIEEVIVAIDKDQYQGLDTILNTLRSFHKTLLIRITPDSYDFLMGHIKMDALYGVALIELPAGRLMIWQDWIKRVADVILSLFLLLLLSPLLLYISIRTAWSSPGPVIYSQVRIGKYGLPFNIFKFRSMQVDSESQGPSLSFDGDPRCTPWGNFMRKWRLDEIPQFVNVIKGDMSIVGPRPERKFFIEQIKLEAPYYSRILTVRPGITSWGQVKYGYASDIKQMVERLKFDLIYVENQSLTLDIKIICYTILVLFQGKGK